MKLGVGLPQRAGVNLRADIAKVARFAENEGFHSIWVYERLAYPTNPSQPMYDVPGLEWNPEFATTADPLTVLAVAASVTDRVRLGSSVIVAPLHVSIQLAKALATIDQISGGGRLIAGIGSGWSRDEFAAAGVTTRKRGEYLDEAIDVLRAAWGPDPVSVNSGRVQIDEVLVRPKPLQPPKLFLGGGYSTAALKRIAQRADGWLPSGMPAKDVMGTWDHIRNLATDAGRDPAQLEMVHRCNITLTGRPMADDRPPYHGNLTQVAADLAANAEAGVAELIIELGLDPSFTTIDRLLETTIELRQRAGLS